MPPSTVPTPRAQSGPGPARLHRGALLLLPALLATGCGAPPVPDGDGARERAAAEALFAAGRLEEAEAGLRDRLARAPTDIEAQVALGNLLFERGRIADAAEVFVALAEAKPENGIYALRAGSALELLGRGRDAERWLERAARQRPGDAEAAWRLGLHHFHRGELAEAESALRQSLAADPKRHDAALKLAQTLDRGSRFSEAIAVLDTAIAGGAPPLLLFQRGLVRSRLGDPQGAVEDLTAVRRLAPDLEGARYALARALLAAGRIAEGEAEMARFAAAEEERRVRTMDDLVARLIGASHADDPEMRRRRLEELSLRQPDNPEVWRLLAAAYERDGDFGQAAVAARRAARLRQGPDAGEAPR